MSGGISNFFLVMENEQERVRKNLLSDVGLFKRNPELLKSGSYTIKSSVSPPEFYAFVDALRGDPITLTTSIASGVKKLCDEFEFTGLDQKFRDFAKENPFFHIKSEHEEKLEREVKFLGEDVMDHNIMLESLQDQIDELLKRMTALEARSGSGAGSGAGVAVVSPKVDPKPIIRDIETKVERLSRENETSKDKLRRIQSEQDELRDLVNELKAKTPNSTPAVPSVNFLPVHRENVLGWLRGKENMFNRQVLVRMDSGNPSSVFDPFSDDGYGGGPRENAWIEVALISPVTVNGFEVTGGKTNCPRTFDVVFKYGTETRATVSFVDEEGLNGKFKKVKRSIAPVRVDCVRLEAKGLNWSDKLFFDLKGFELFSPDDRYKDGVFRSLYQNSREHIQKILEVSARDFDGSYLHNPSTKKNVCTLVAKDNAWVEVELVHGRLIPTGYRIKRGKGAPRAWSLRGSNDRDADIGQWLVLHKMSEHEQPQTSDILSFECANALTPFKYFRVVMEAPRWDGQRKLNFSHLELDGIFFSE